MKEIFDDRRVFELHATIAAGYYMLRQIAERKPRQRAPIEIAIENETLNAIAVLEDIIRAKKELGADYQDDENMLAEAVNLRDKMKGTV